MASPPTFREPGEPGFVDPRPDLPGRAPGSVPSPSRRGRKPRETPPETSAPAPVPAKRGPGRPRKTPKDIGLPPVPGTGRSPSQAATAPSGTRQARTRAPGSPRISPPSGRARRTGQIPPAPVTAVVAHHLAREAARDLAGGDISRLRTQDSRTVLVLNYPGQTFGPVTRGTRGSRRGTA